MRKLKKYTGSITSILFLIAFAVSAYIIKNDSIDTRTVQENCIEEMPELDNNTLLWESLPQHFISNSIFN